MNEVIITIPVWFLLGVAAGCFISVSMAAGYKIYLQRKIDKLNCAIAWVKAEQKNEQL